MRTESNPPDRFNVEAIRARSRLGPNSDVLYWRRVLANNGYDRRIIEQAPPEMRANLEWWIAEVRKRDV